MRTPLSLATLLILTMALVGCGPSNSPPPVDPAAGGHDEHAGHDHSGHDHAAHGPNGGHIAELGSAYHVEWLHDDMDGKVALILLDGEMKDEVATATKATIHVTIADGEPQAYELTAIAATDGGSTTSRFELVEPALATALAMGEGVTCVLSIEIDGKPFSTKIGHAAGGGDAH